MDAKRAIELMDQDYKYSYLFPQPLIDSLLAGEKPSIWLQKEHCLWIGFPKENLIQIPLWVRPDAK